LGPSSFVTRSERYLVAADIRLDNGAELAAALGLRSTDPGVLLAAAWDRWGPKAVERLIGDFALAVYDEVDRTLLLARDPSGQRPLFFARSEGLTLAASTPGGLRAALPGAGCNPAALARYLLDGGLAAGESWFDGVERVMPGECVWLGPEAIRRHSWWNPSLERRTSPNEAFAEELRGLLDDAVACRIAGAARPVASQLSSGFDSSAVTAAAVRLFGAEAVLAFTSAPLSADVGPLIRGRTADESGAAAATARWLGINHRIVRQTPPIFDVLRDQTRLAQMPLTPFNMAWWSEIRHQAAAAGADTMLIGAMGNLTLSAGGLWALPDYIRAGRMRAWLREATAAARRPDTRWRGILFNSFAPWLPGRVWHGLRRYFLRVPPPGSLSFLRHEWRSRTSETDAEALPLPDQAADRLHAIRTDDPGMLRAAAIADCGVAELDPTADRRLIEFSLRLPPEQLLREGRPRPLVKEAIGDRLPPGLFDAPLRGLQSADWYLRLSQQTARDLAETVAALPLAAELIDLPALNAAIDRWPSDGFNQPETVAEYCFAVANALSVGVFIEQCGEVSRQSRTPH
jgi:asparagine synthase (glutamine-hydrolysing)